MIVDDEPLILAGISSMLVWEDYDCEIVGKVTNGVQALEKMDQLHPDIVITDIKMPAMDGIEFMKEAKRLGYPAVFIILTNLEEFSLAREAIRLGAVDYLMKLELTEEKLLDALLAAKERSPRAGQDTEEVEPPVLTITREERIRNYFREVLVYDREAEDSAATVSLVRSTFAEPLLVLIHFNYGFEGFSRNFTRVDQKKMMGFAEDIIGEMVRGFFAQNCLLRREQNSFILVLSTRGVADYQAQVKRMATKFLSVIKDYFEVYASVAVSQRGERIEELPELLYQVMSAMNHTYYESGEAIIFYSEACEENDGYRGHFDINFLKKDLAHSIRHNDSEQFEAIMEQFIGLLKEYKPSRPQAINGCSSLYYFIISFFEEQEETLFPYSVDVISQLNHMEHLKDIIKWTQWFCRRVLATLEERRNRRSDKNVELAQEYVNRHYKEKISLGQVAESLNISQGHLSSTFKKQTGMNFSDYVNEIKITKAKELIETHQYMMYEISDILGFDTQYYFSTVFKKMTGFTPKEYEAQTLGKNS